MRHKKQLLHTVVDLADLCLAPKRRVSEANWDAKRLAALPDLIGSFLSLTGFMIG